MSIVDSLRKGFRFLLMSFGVSTYPQKGRPLKDAKKASDIPPGKPE